MKLRLTARARLAWLAALLSAGAVLGAVMPFVIDSSLRERRLELRSVQVALANVSLSLRSGDSLDGLIRDSSIHAVALLDAEGAPLSVIGTTEGEAQALHALCPPSLTAGVVWLKETDRALVACTRLSHEPGVTLLGVADSPEALRRDRLTQVTVLAFAFASLAAAMSIGAVRRLLSPLTGMTAAARQLARGETDLTLPEPADPELVPLADALRQLAVARNAQLDDIQQRLELTRQLAAIVAHEVRNPLQSLTMLADVVAHEPDAEARALLLQAIQQELTMIETVVQRLLGSGGDLRLVRRSTNLAELIDRALILIGPAAREAKVKLSAEIGQPLTAEVDSAMMRRALENVVRNAVSILGAAGGGRVVVRLEGAGDGWARVVVDDSGSGVAPTDRARIFELGVTGRPGGSGLGLPLARMVANAHGGNLGVEESPLGGARFTFLIPLSTETT